MSNLSPRLQAVLGLLAAGYTYKEVALTLGLKRDTARKYAQRATTRLGARTVIQAVVMFERDIKLVGTNFGKSESL